MTQDSTITRFPSRKISTGSIGIDSVLGGGLAIAAITDVYGSAGTGKTQFAFQNAVTTCEHFLESKGDVAEPYVVFIDCSGSFRPERIAEMLTAKGTNADRVLDRISCISVRSVSEQKKASHRVENDPIFSKCRLLIVDDVTVNFTEDYAKAEEVATRQWDLSVYLRHLAFICNQRGISVLLTNSVRSRGEIGEGETTGEIISAFALYRLHFKRIDRSRVAILESPVKSENSVTFVIDQCGLH